MAEVTTTPEAPAPAPVPTPEPATPASAPQQHSNGLAIAALVVGIVAVLSGWAPFWGVVVGVAAVVLGILALKKNANKGMAIAGLVTGAVGALWSLIITALFIVALTAGSVAINSAQKAIDDVTSEGQALTEAKKDFAKGETANFADKFEVKVNSVEMNFSPGQFYTPSEGKQYIKVNATVKNISDESQYVSPYTFGVLDNGISVSASYISSDTQMTSGDLTAGATVTGDAVYEVSQDANDLKLTYKTTVYDKEFKAQELNYTLAF